MTHALCTHAFMNFLNFCSFKVLSYLITLFFLSFIHSIFNPLYLFLMQIFLFILNSKLLIKLKWITYFKAWSLRLLMRACWLWKKILFVNVHNLLFMMFDVANSQQYKNFFLIVSVLQAKLNIMFKKVKTLKKYF